MKMKLTSIIGVFMIVLALAGCASKKCDCPSVGELPTPAHLEEASASLCN